MIPDDQIPVAYCHECGYIWGDDLEYNFPNPSVCDCGNETDRTTVAQEEMVRSLADDGPAPERSRRRVDDEN
jgi:hypothetical protein